MMKINVLHNVLKRLLFPFIIACTIGFIYNIVSIWITAGDTVIYYPLQLWKNSSEIFNLIYPLFSALPFCWILYYEKKNGYLNFVSARIPLKSYLSTHYFGGALLSFFCMIFISISGLILSLYIIEPQFVEEFHNEFAGSLLEEMKLSNPLVYGLLLSLWRGFISILMYSFGFFLSLISKHLFIILTGSFIYSILENFATALMGCPVLSICTAFEPSRMNFKNASIPSEVAVFVGPAILIIICLCGLLPYYIVQEKKENGTFKN